MSTRDEEELEGFTAIRNANTKALRREHAWGGHKEEEGTLARVRAVGWEWDAQPRRAF